MKQTMRFLSIAVLVTVGAMTMSCSKAEVNVEPQQEDNVVILTTTVGLEYGAETRALTAGGVKTFAAGETMAIVYKNTAGETVKAVSASLADDGDITNSGKSATFTFQLSHPDKEQDVTYIYPAAMAKDNGDINYDALAEQDGTLDNLASNLDLATYSGAWNGSALPTGTLTNQLAILAITLKNEAGSSIITSGLTQVTISDGTYSYTVTPTGSNFGSNVIYVAIHPTSSANIEVTATDGAKNYTKSLTGKTYNAGNGYSLSWRMAEAAPALNITSPAVGQVIGDDGKNYAYASLPGGVTAVAKICYVSGSNGLALALADEGQMNWSTAISTCAVHTPAFTNGTWKLATQDEWNNMISGAGSYTALRDGFSGITGASNLQEDCYWSSTDYNDGQAWLYYFELSGWSYESKSYTGGYVRASLVF